MEVRSLKTLIGRSRYARVTVSLVTALIGGILFKLLHLPVPWLLGPMLTVLAGSNFMKESYEWPQQFRSVGMVIVGYTIGLSMTMPALRQMSHQLPNMLLMTVLLLLLCVGIAFINHRLSGIDYNSALLGSIPGGLTQVISLAEETEGINLLAVMMTQVIRLIMIIVIIPLLVFSPFFDHGQTVTTAAIPSTIATAAHSSSSPLIMLLFAVVCIAGAFLGKKIHLPTPLLLGPVIATATLQLLGLTGTALPGWIINAAQLLIGVNVGMMLKPGRMEHKFRTISIAIGCGLLLVVGAWGLSLLLVYVQSVSGATALLSLAPGGMDQMGIIAHEIGADLAIVAGYQLFRTFFIMFAIPPLIRLLFRIQKKKKSTKQGDIV
ncbi:AbrB family transcriptional regulator [Paenibacillus lutimineralis]|uniref:AbrB family transcriptional regulator n=1 Tax=Paenibacillus lutimineralis TaxID=2707005 RepID=A0A3S9V1G8_9BACL|nr:AbrB family transcriptional regulator [Paenibacillus lutimineralis]